MKKVISIALSLVLAVGLLSLPSASAAALTNAKITDELSAAITKDGSAKAFVTMNDVDHAKVMKTFMTEYPAEFEAYTQAKFDVAASSGIEITDELVQSAVERKREIYREYYTAANQAVISACVASKNVTFVSAYSPIAIVEVNRTEALQLAKNENVLKLEAVPVISEAETEQQNTRGYSYEEAKSALEAANVVSGATTVRDTYYLRGSGVKVGVMESEGIPNTANPYLNGTTINIQPGDVGTSDHATLIAIIIAGRSGTTYYGAAPDAILYCTKFGDNTSKAYSDAEWLITQGVNVINASFRIDTSGAVCGTYADASKWFDHIAVMHDVHVVASSGNMLPSEPAAEGWTGDNWYVHDTGMAYNAITVGGYRVTGGRKLPDYTVAYPSSYMERAGSSSLRAEKPNLIGNYYYQEVENETVQPISPIAIGTSFAAPQVTGAVAQLCSYNWQLKFKQTAIGAILMAAATKKADAISDGLLGQAFSTSVRVEDNEQVSDKEGAGILNALNAYHIVANGTYWSPTVYAANFPYTKTLTINASGNSLCRVAIFWLARASVSDHASGIATSTGVADLDIVVRNPNGQYVDQSILEFANFEIVQFEPSVSGNYTLQIIGSSTEKEYIGIALLNEVIS